MLAKKSAIPCNDIIACLIHQKKNWTDRSNPPPPTTVEFFLGIIFKPQVNFLLYVFTG